MGVIGVAGKRVTVFLVIALIAAVIPIASARAGVGQVRLRAYDSQPLDPRKPRYVSGSVAIADVNGDGRDDLLVTAYYRESSHRLARLYVFEQSRHGGLAAGTWKSLRSQGRRLDITTADFDGDGDDDVAVATNDGIQIFHNTPRGLRWRRTVAPFKDTSRFYALIVEAGDLDLDGRPDLVVDFHRRTVVLKQTRKGGFRRVATLARKFNDEIKIGALAGDRNPDILLTPSLYSGMKLYVQQENWNFRERDFRGSAEGIEVADVTGDGRVDMIRTDHQHTPQGQVHLYKQTKRGFRHNKQRVYDLPAAVAAADMDLDGIADIVVEHTGWHSVGVLVARRDGSMSRERLIPSNTSSADPNDMATGDIDGDGRPDVVLTPRHNKLILHYSRPPRCHAKRATIVGSAGDDVLEGTVGSDVIWSGGGDDLIRGKAGRDLICTSSGKDVVLAGRGRDVVKAGVGADIVLGGPHDDDLRGGIGKDIVIYGARKRIRVDLSRGLASGQGRDRLSNFEHVVGTDRSDVLIGNKKNNIIFGGGGNDRINGRKGDDVLQPFGGDDKVVGGQGADTVTYNDFFASDDAVSVAVDLESGTARGRGRDALYGIESVIGSNTSDVLLGSGEDDALYALSGDDEMEGRGGSDVLAPGFGDDQVDGGAGDDFVDYSFGAYEDGFEVHIDLSAGSAEYPAGRGVDSLLDIENVVGSQATNEIIGDDGPNALYGLNGFDQIKGGAGDDLLDGGPKDDILDGGEGFDHCLDGETLTGCESEQRPEQRRLGSENRSLTTVIYRPVHNARLPNASLERLMHLIATLELVFGP